MKAAFTRGGEPKHDYRFAHCYTRRQGRTYLGTIASVFRDEDQTVRIRVNYMDGTSWPFDPPLSEVEILERTFESGDEV